MTADAADTYPVPLHGWTCFHCGAHFGATYGGMRAARLHFGETPVETPLCLELLEFLKSDDRAAAAVKRVRQMRVDLLQAYAQREHADEIAEGLQGSLSSIAARFKVSSAWDAYAKFESMEGRALCAEAIVRAVEKRDLELAMAARLDVCGPGVYYPSPLSEALDKLSTENGPCAQPVHFQSAAGPAEIEATAAPAADMQSEGARR